MPKREKDEIFSSIERPLKQWRQGDCVLGEFWFAFRIDPETSITVDSPETDLPESKVEGFVVLTQTCDIIRDCDRRPYIEVAPLCNVDEADLRNIKKLRTPRYAFIPNLENQSLVADLDKVMTVEKSAVAKWERVPGWNTEEELQHFVRALVRKRGRFAFPDDFYNVVNSLKKLLKKEIEVSTKPEASDAIRSLEQIRVMATPSWNSPKIELTFWFIRSENTPNFNGTSWDVYKDLWIGLTEKSEKYEAIDGMVTTLSRMTAIDYLTSPRLDLDDVTPPQV